MSSSPPDAFQIGPDRHNACISNYMQFEELAACYLRSGDELVASVARDHSTLDVHIYAICYLYRHSFELQLKDLSQTSQ